jgi:hypothetical protein
MGSMSLPPSASSPALRDWSFDDLLREGLSLIPAHAPEWTNHNASDPGITLVELLAYFTELLVYRLGRVTPAAKLEFLRLLEGCDAGAAKRLAEAPGKLDRHAVDDAIARTVAAMSRSECLVTAADFERAAVEVAREHLQANGHPDVSVRVVCLSGEALRQRLLGRRRGHARAHVGVVVLPGAPLAPDAMDAMCREVRQAVSRRCLLATTLHVFAPTMLHATVAFRLTLRHGANARRVLDEVANRLSALAEMARGALRVTDITDRIDSTDGVDHVDEVTFVALGSHAEQLGDARSSIGVQIAIRSTPGVDARLGLLPELDSARLRRDDAGRLAAIALQPWEQVRLHLARSAIEAISPGVVNGGEAT